MVSRTIIRTNKELTEIYNNLKRGDIIVGTVGIKRSEEFKFLDLAERILEKYGLNHTIIARS